jgi:hypothetical protein
VTSYRRLVEGGDGTNLESHVLCSFRTITIGAFNRATGNSIDNGRVYESFCVVYRRRGRPMMMTMSIGVGKGSNKCLSIVGRYLLK